MPDDEPLDTVLDRRLRAVADAYAPAGRPPFEQLRGRARRRRRSRAAGVLVAVALVAAVPTVLLPALRDRGGSTGQTLAAGQPDDGLCADASRRYAAWLAADRSRTDLRRLPRREVSASYVPGPATLQAALAPAERVVVGTVTDVRVDAGGSRTTMRVDRTVRGPGAGELIVTGYTSLQPPHEEPVYGPKTGTGLPPQVGVRTAPASLTVDPTAPLLLPGQRAVWLLVGDGGDGLTVEPTAGQYVSCRGSVTATDGNRFAREVDGLTEEQLLARLAG